MVGKGWVFYGVRTTSPRRSGLGLGFEEVVSEVSEVIIIGCINIFVGGGGSSINNSVC